jgi:sugar/nucleoside kinase (ribokinase family)
MSGVLVVGDIVTDIVAVQSGALAVGSDTAASISLTGGGSAANTAAWLSTQDTVVGLAGVVGTDIAGDDRINELTAAGVDCQWVRRSSAAPTGSVIVLAQSSERSMLCDRGANLLLIPSDVDKALSGMDPAHVHLSGYTLLDGTSLPAGRHALAAASARGITTSVDAASAAPLRRVGGATFLDWIRGTDILFANLDEAHALLDELASSDRGWVDPVRLAVRLARVARYAVVKLGSDGAIWADASGAVVRVPAVPARLLDPTGAGDAFAAGLLATWLTGSPIEACLTAATRLGARAVSVVGGRPPTTTHR